VRFDQKLLLENKAWASQKTLGDTDYFLRLSKGQSPSVLWVGCSDSRVPAEDITNSSPGEVFVHRNIGNQVQKDDPNALSVVEYAVSVLKVRHVVVCGHYECGGMRAALGMDEMSGSLAVWLSKIRRTCENELPSLRVIDDKEHGANLLAEKNVLHQVQNLMSFDFIRKGVTDGSLLLHGWIFDMKSGLLKDLTGTK